jgi:hypothetical protein
MMHYLGDCRSCDEGKRNREAGREDAHRFGQWNLQEMSYAQDKRLNGD